MSTNHRAGGVWDAGQPEFRLSDSFFRGESSHPIHRALGMSVVHLKLAWIVSTEEQRAFASIGEFVKVCFTDSQEREFARLQIACSKFLEGRRHHQLQKIHEIKGNYVDTVKGTSADLPSTLKLLHLSPRMLMPFEVVSVQIADESNSKRKRRKQRKKKQQQQEMSPSQQTRESFNTLENYEDAVPANVDDRASSPAEGMPIADHENSSKIPDHAEQSFQKPFHLQGFAEPLPSILRSHPISLATATVASVPATGDELDSSPRRAGTTLPIDDTHDTNNTDGSCDCKDYKHDVDATTTRTTPPRPRTPSFQVVHKYSIPERVFTSAIDHLCANLDRILHCDSKDGSSETNHKTRSMFSAGDHDLQETEISSASEGMPHVRDAVASSEEQQTASAPSSSSSSSSADAAKREILTSFILSVEMIADALQNALLDEREKHEDTLQILKLRLFIAQNENDQLKEQIFKHQMKTPTT